MNSKKILIIKTGADGDVIRSTFVIPSLRECGWEVYWYTSDRLVEFLSKLPDVKLATGTFSSLWHIEFDILLSLEENIDITKKLKDIRFKRLIGVYTDEENQLSYTIDSAIWFDMSLISRYGVNIANVLKRNNRISYPEIMCQILNIPKPRHVSAPEFIKSRSSGSFDSEKSKIALGLNLDCGPRWPQKRFPPEYRVDLIRGLQSKSKAWGKVLTVYLYGIGENNKSNIEIAEKLSITNVFPVDTKESISSFASEISKCDILISSDSLGMHLGLLLQIPTIAFFTSSPAHEFYSTSTFIKVLSVADDYCSFSPNADNSTITAERIIDAVDYLISHNGLADVIQRQFPDYPAPDLK
jgi:heptosyltransferase-2